uniref:Tubulin delta chain n=1 Tax=Halisarca dujardinii TaxID=2583056 RepID=A0A9E9FV98_HALDU|nr:tubulin zeta [Halisarca dujardinii]
MFAFSLRPSVGLNGAKLNAARMSAVFVQIGQCGNQVGHSFWSESVDILHCENKKTGTKHGKNPSYSERLNSLLTNSGKLPLILLDSEAKPATLFRTSGDLGHFVREENVIIEKTGRGGNWAFGYCGDRKVLGKGGDRNELLDLVIGRHRRELERSEHFTGTVVFHSLAGGTGSGLGSRLVEELRSEHPKSFLLSVAVAPHSLGESPLQHYNALLTLSHLQQFADGVVLFQNDSVLEDTSNLKTSLQKPGASKAQPPSSVSLADMNSYIGGCMANALMPIYTSSMHSRISCSAKFEHRLWDLISTGCPDSKMKFLTPVYAHNSLSGRASWDKLATRLKHTSSMSPAFAGCKRMHTSSLFAMARMSSDSMVDFDRGVSAKLKLDFQKHFNFSDDKLKSPYLCLQSPEPNFSQRKSVSAFCNSSIVCGFVGDVLQKSKVKLDSGAYLHWYSRYGCHAEDFGAATETCRGVLERYMQIP